jgi:small subunit ribosomal protein S6
MTREYELVYIFDSTLEEAQVNERLERFHALMQTPEHQEPVTDVHHWGKRTLAYSIAGKETGYYVVVRFEVEPEVLGELERAIKLDDGVIRYLIVLNEGLAPMGAAVEPKDVEPKDTVARVSDDREDDE